MGRSKRKLFWRLCCGAAVIIMMLAYSPLLLPGAEVDMPVWGMPFTLWTGIGLCIVMVTLTFLATLVHPGRTDEPPLV